MGYGFQHCEPARHGHVGRIDTASALAGIAGCCPLRRGRPVELCVSGGSSGSAGFSTIEGVRAIFASDGGVTIGWIHYLAFDLFAGLWIARDADAKNFSRLVQAPILVATFMAGPVGLFLWLVIREKRARSAGRWK